MAIPLNVIQPSERIEYGFKRTKCACKLCSLGCKFTPGMLGPDDLPRIAAYLGYTDLKQFARENLFASAGAKIALFNRDRGTIYTFRVTTLVPARQANGHCKFYVDGKCSIHEVAPFGCAFFDAHQKQDVAQERSAAVHAHIKAQHDTNGVYGQLWKMLKGEGRVGPPPETLRAAWGRAERNLRTGHTPKKDRNKPKKRR